MGSSYGKPDLGWISRKNFLTVRAVWRWTPWSREVALLLEAFRRKCDHPLSDMLWFGFHKGLDSMAFEAPSHFMILWYTIWIYPTQLTEHHHAFLSSDQPNDSPLHRWPSRILASSPKIYFLKNLFFLTFPLTFQWQVDDFTRCPPSANATPFLSGLSKALINKIINQQIMQW